MPIQRAARSADELALLRTACADLSDPVTLSVYADFLEEHGDRRGAFLRDFLRAFAAHEPLPPFPPDVPAAWADVLALPVRRRLRHGIEPVDPRWSGLAKEAARRFPAIKPLFDRILRGAAPALRLEVGEPLAAEALPLGTTRAGGPPDLPVGTPHPSETAFLLQIDLADLRGTLADGLLPEGGLLLLFYDPADPSRQLIYVPPGTPLVRHTAAGDDEPPHSVLLSDSLKVGRGAVEGLPDDFDLNDLTYADLFFDRSYSRHWLCPWYRPGACWRWDALDPPGDYLKLAEFGTHSHLSSWSFGDGDPLHVFLPREDARAGRCDRVQMLDVS